MKSLFICNPCRQLYLITGSCLSYGHACWGGHGKRSDSHISSRRDADMSMLPRWYLSRLIQKPLNRKNIFGSRADGFNLNEIFRNDDNIKSREDSEINEITDGQNDDDVIMGNSEPRMLEKRALGHN
nr:unnamed protein product [Callosobruchus chinensis]